MQTMSPPFTRALYDRLPEGFPAQLVDGALLHDPTPLRGHQALVGAIFLTVAPLVGLRRAFVSPVDVVLDDLNVLQPDVAVWETPPPLDRRAPDVPLVVFEVLSPSSRRLDREVKAGKYLAAGVREVWLVDPDEETVEIRTPEERRVFRRSDEARSAAIEGFGVVPAALFGPLRP
jgi:Uma2 family endonuclease